MSTPEWVVKEVQPREDYSLLITFANGQRRVFDTRPLLERKMYAKLKELPFFMRAKIDCGTVVWNDDIDIAPEFLYERSLPI